MYIIVENFVMEVLLLKNNILIFPDGMILRLKNWLNSLEIVNENDKVDYKD